MANSGQFQKGRAKTGGRKAGTPNVSSGPLRTLLSEYAVENFPQYIEALEALRLKDTLSYVRAYNELLRHVLPGLQSIALSMTTAQSTTIAEQLRSLADKASEANE